MEIIKLQKEKLIVDPDNPDLCQEIEQFLFDNDAQIENIPVTIIVNPPIRAVIENASELSEILIEISDAYRTEGNYILELYNSSAGIIIMFNIEHSSASLTHEIGHC